MKYRYSKGIGVIIDCEQEIKEGNFLEFEPKLREITSAVKGGDEEGVVELLVEIGHWMKHDMLAATRRRPI